MLNSMTSMISYARPRELPRNLAKNVVAALDGELITALIFSLKTFTAALLGLFIAFWLALDEPYWALLTVFIVAQPDSGLVLAKGFYRLLGTAAGVLMTVALVFAFAQYGELFIASLAVWIGLCCFAARAVRGFATYSFQLAGYTVAIVGVPAALNPNAAYPIILARATEISLGIGCMALVSRLIWPRELAPKLIALVHELLRRVDRFAGAAMGPGSAREQLAAERAELAKDFGTAEAMRSSAFFESADVRLLNEPLRTVAHSAVDLYAVADEAAARRLDPSPHGAGDQDPGVLITNSKDTPRENGEIISALLRATNRRAIAGARGRLYEAEAVLDGGKSVAGPTPAGRFWSDPVTAALTGIRAALALAITTAFWFATAWPSGATAVVMAGVASTLLATTEQPEKITMAAGATILVAATPVYITLLHLLPRALDFISMAAVLAPLFLGCAFIIACPRIGPLGLLAAVYFAVISHIDNNNVASYDAVNFFNTSLGILVGIGVSVALFATFFPETPAWVGRRFRRQLFVQLSHLAARQPALQAFRFALCEQLAATLARVKDEPGLARDCLVGGATALSTGQAIDRLRTAIGADWLAPAIADEVSGLLASISRTCLNPSRASLTRSAWEARALCRRSLVMARAASNSHETDALAEILVGCEALRSDLLKARMFLPEKSDVH